MTQPTELHYVTTPFGQKGGWAAGYHTGVDYRAPVGTQVFATRGGKVIHVGWGGWGQAYGVHVIIRSRFKGKKVQHMYAHLSEARVVKGEKVQAGDPIGLSGVTGNTNGPHLHYEERVRPFGYYNHRRPLMPDWKPKNDWRSRLLERLGV